MNISKKLFFIIVFVLLFTFGLTAIPMANLGIQTVSKAPITALGTQNILWNTTSDFNSYEFNNCTIGTNVMNLSGVGIAYDFTNDENGDDPAGWTVTESDNTSVEVVASVGGHGKVVKFYDNSTSAAAFAQNAFSAAQSSGAIEFWFYTDDASTFFRIKCDSAFSLHVFEDWLWYWNGLNWHGIRSLSDSTWYHIRVTFECGDGSHDGLSADQYNVYVDNVKYGAYGFVNAVDNLSNLNLATYWYYYLYGQVGAYIDAVDYSWTEGYFTNRSYDHYGEYSSKSIWESTAQDLLDNNPYYNNITFSSQTNANTSVYISYQDSQNNNPGSWSPWSAWSSSTIFLNQNGHKYIRVRTLLNTSNPLQTPVLEWINFCYTT